MKWTLINTHTHFTLSTLLYYYSLSTHSQLTSQKSLSLNMSNKKQRSENMTVKPRAVAVRRLGRDTKNLNTKLCVTLDNAEAVKDVILSSRILRASQDSDVKRVYFNHDPTRLQSEEAYARRMAKRSSGAQKNAPITSSALHQPFRG